MNRTLIVLTILIAILIIGDIVTTDMVIAQGGNELNLFMQSAIQNVFLHAAIKICALLVGVFLMALLLKKFVKQATKDNPLSSFEAAFLKRVEVYPFLAFAGWFVGVNISNLLHLFLRM